MRKFGFRGFLGRRRPARGCQDGLGRSGWRGMKRCWESKQQLPALQSWRVKRMPSSIKVAVPMRRTLDNSVVDSTSSSSELTGSVEDEHCLGCNSGWASCSSAVASIHVLFYFSRQRKVLRISKIWWKEKTNKLNSSQGQWKA